MKVGSKDAADSAASFALLFVKNYAILDLSDKISAGGWWIPKCCFFTALKSDNAQQFLIISNTENTAVLDIIRTNIHEGQD